MKFKLFLFLFPFGAFAGVGVNGGPGGPLDQVTLELLYGTFSLGGSSFDYVATNVPLLIDDQGSTLLGSVDATTSLDPRIYAGITALLATGSMSVTLTAPFSTCTPEPSCTPAADGTTTFSTTTTTDNIAFSTGGLGQIGNVTDPSQIIAEAEILDLITAGSVASSTPEGSLTFTVTSDELVSGHGVVATLTDYAIDLEELDFNGTAPAGAAVPEPSSFAPGLMCLVIFALLRISRKTECGAKQFLTRMAVRTAPFALVRINKFGEAARRRAGPAGASRRFPS